MKLSRQTMLWFGSSSDSSSVGVFGSIAPGGPGATYSKVISTIQSLPAWGSGWKAEVVSPLRPAIQDFNAVDYVFSYGICYLHEMGIPEWDAGTVYYQYSICQYGGVIYQSLTDTNLNNTPTPGAYWSVLNYVDLTTGQTVSGIKTFSSFPVTPSSAPSTNYQVANKKYVDDQIAGISTVTKVSLGIDSGLASGINKSSTTTINFNFTFASAPVVVISKTAYPGSDQSGVYVESVGTTSFNARGYNTDSCPISWIAIGTKA